VNYQLIISEKAESDLLESYLWYEFKRNGLGEEFVLTVEAAINVISRMPLAFPIRYKKMHGLPIRRFPYLILYTVHLKVIKIMAVFHTSQAPNF